MSTTVIFYKILPNYPSSLSAVICSSDNNTDHLPVALVDDPLHCILQLQLALISHHTDLSVDAVLHKLFYGLSEDIGIPDPLFRLLRVFNVLDQILRLLLGGSKGSPP